MRHLPGGSPEVARVSREYAKEVAFIGVPGRDSADAMQAFVDQYGLEFPQAVTEDGSLWSRFGVAYQPAWVFVNDDGGSALVPSGLAPGDLERVLDDLIAR